MKSVFFAAALVAASGVAQAATIYNDAENDLFDNGFSNLDIKSVSMSHDANNVYLSVETRGYQNWTKYMIYMNVSTASDYTGTNAWNRPANLTTNISHYVGSWVDQPNTNQQNWAWDGFSWNMDGGTTNNDQSQTGANIVTFTISRSFLGLMGNGVILFDVGTSGGGGGDPAVDCLSRNTPSTTGWGDPSTSGNFLAYTIPAPGSLALVGLAGLAAGRRRR
ncbi:MAG: PEP-CTERM sorting domain-containing protein [Phycisphaerales bacterium]